MSKRELVVISRENEKLCKFRGHIWKGLRNENEAKMTGQIILNLIHKLHLLTKLKNHQGALKATWPRGVQKFVPLAPDG